MKKTAVIILHYDNESDTKTCLESVLEEGNGTSYIIVSNSPSNSFKKNLTRAYPQIYFLESRRNTGFAGGSNIGIKKALKLGSEFIILLNNDVLASKGLVSHLVSFAEKDEKIGLVSPKIYFAKGFEYHRNYKDKEKGKVIWYAGGLIDKSNVYASHRGVDEVDHGQYSETIETDFVTGCCMLIKRKVIEKIGLFNEKYFLYFEDVDYSLRAKRAGFKTIFSPGTYLWHKNASASGKPGSDLHLYYQTRNRLYFGFRYFSPKTKLALFRESLSLFLEGGVRFKAIKDYYLGKMGKGTL